jgi:glycosyltransferase involved in cell wall biosynthesis
MKILIIHNRYKFEGGEEAMVSAEIDLLRNKGHEVVISELNNNAINKYSILQKLKLPFRVIWSRDFYKQVRSIIIKENPDIAHVHNTFFLMSPSVYYACRDEKVPVVQTLHNYRFLCPLGTLYRNGKICRECLDKNLLMSIKYKCGSKSKLWTLAMLCILKFHYRKHTFKKFIDTYIALTDFSKQQFVNGGFDGEKIKVKPNFMNFDPTVSSERERYILYVGRLSPEKGTDILLEAWKKLDYLPLKLIGTGISYKELQSYVKKHSLNIEILGKKPHHEVMDYIKKSLILVLPSRCNENFPLTLVEAFACGTPVIASRTGALAEIIEHGKTGLLFDPGSPGDLAEKVKLVYQNTKMAEAMSKNARYEYESKYTAQRNYEMLMSIYEGTIKDYKN